MFYSSHRAPHCIYYCRDIPPVWRAGRYTRTSRRPSALEYQSQSVCINHQMSHWSALNMKAGLLNLWSGSSNGISSQGHYHDHIMPARGMWKLDYILLSGYHSCMTSMPVYKGVEVAKCLEVSVTVGLYKSSNEPLINIKHESRTTQLMIRPI